MKDFEEQLGELLIRAQDPTFDTEGFLRAHPSCEQALRERVVEFRAAGLLPLPVVAGSVLPGDIPACLEARYGVRGVDLHGRGPIGASTLLPGRLINGRYRLFEELKSGGQARILRGYDEVLRAEVALKILKLPLSPAADAQAKRARIERSYREACVHAQLDHPAIVPVHDLALLEDDRLVLVMKFVRGTSLRQLIEDLNEGRASCRDSFPLRRQVEIVKVICLAVQRAHERGVVHRDLTPNNIMVGKSGEVYLLDWGLAKLDAHADEGPSIAGGAAPPRAAGAGLTLTDDIVGSPRWMSPEQVSREVGPISRRTDVFGIGAVLYNLVTGNPPYSGSGDEVLRRAARADLSDRQGAHAKRAAPEELLAICSHAMAFVPAKRYPSPEEIVADLDAFLEHRPSPRWIDPPARRLVKWVRRRPTHATALGAGALFLALLGIAGTFLWGQAQRLRAVEHQQQVAELTTRMEKLLQREDDGTPESILRVYCEQAQACLTLLSKWDLHFDTADAPAQSAARLQSVAEPEVREKLVELMFLTIRFLGMSGLGRAAEYQLHGSAPPQEAAEWAAMAQQHPAETAAWSRLLEGVPLLVAHNMGKESVAAFRAFLMKEDVDTRSLVGRLDECAPADLDLFSYVVTSVLPSNEAALVLDKVLQLSPGHALAHVRRGSIAFRGGETELARTHWTAALAAWPRCNSARVNLAALASDAGDKLEEERLLDAVLRDDPGNYRASTNLAQNLFEQERYADALKQLDVLVPRCPLQSELQDILLNRAVCLTHIAEKQDGTRATPAVLDAYADLRHRFPDYWKGHYNAGGILLDAGRFEESLRALDDALRTAPSGSGMDLDELYTDQAAALWALNRRVEAVQKLIGYLEHRPAATDDSRAALRKYADELEGTVLPPDIEQRLVDVLDD